MSLTSGVNNGGRRRDDSIYKSSFQILLIKKGTWKMHLDVDQRMGHRPGGSPNDGSIKTDGQTDERLSNEHELLYYRRASPHFEAEVPQRRTNGLTSVKHECFIQLKLTTYTNLNMNNVSLLSLFPEARKRRHHHQQSS